MPVDEACPAPGQYTEGSTPTITASANDGYKFEKWTGSPAGTVDPAQEKSTSVTVTMDQNRSLTANFSEVCQPLSLSTNGSGEAIKATPVKRSCPEDYWFKAGETTTLTAEAASGWQITSWDIGATNYPISNKIYPLTMPALPADESLLVQVNYEENATFGFPSELPQTVAEGAGIIDIEVTRAENTLPDAATIQFKTVDGTAIAGKDYVKKEGNLRFEEEQNSAKISIEILPRKTGEGTKSFTVRLSKSDPDIKLGITSAEIQIIDKPTVHFEESVYTVDESATSIKVAVTVSPLPEDVDVFVDFETQDGTATAGEDYTAVSDHTFRIRLTSGKTRAIVPIEIEDDDLDEPDEETVRLILSNPVNAVLPDDSEGILRILDDDDPPIVAFSEADYFIQKSSSQTSLIPVNLSAPSEQDVNVDYKVTLERTGDTAEGTLLFAAGEQTTDIDVSLASAVIDDLYTLQLSNPVNAELRTDDPQFPNAARLYVLDTTIEDCHELTLSFTGYGQPPLPIGKTSSLGCPGGYYVAGELVDITGQPDTGWYVASWSGTIDDESMSLQNAVEMPDAPHAVNAAYRVPIFFAVVNKAQEQFAGPNEDEPNNLFSQANGPILLNKDYRGSFSDDEDINDLYYFIIDQQTRVSITLKDIPGGRDYDLILYDEGWINGEIAAESREFDNNPERIDERLQPGTYFIQVYAGESAPSAARYRLQVASN